MVRIGTPFTKTAKRLLLLGAGELGKEIVIEAQRLGVETIACDHYANAPAMQVATRAHVLDMGDAIKLQQVINHEQPHLIVPEIEAINTQALLKAEETGIQVVPTAKAVDICMNREKLRRLASETLGLKTSPYQIVDNKTDCRKAVESIGLPCFVKPIMSSSGKGQSKVTKIEQVNKAYERATQTGRTQGARVIVEAIIPFEDEITILTVRHQGGTLCCDPIGHFQESGDYRLSWQPHPMMPQTRLRAEEIAKTITNALGGWGLFGVELFIKGDEIYFNEVSPRPHDTGMVTMISQNLSEFALHIRAILGLPIPLIRHYGPAASHVILAKGQSSQVMFDQLQDALSLPDTELRLFGKPGVDGQRRMGVVLALGETVDAAKDKVNQMVNAIKVLN